MINEKLKVIMVENVYWFFRKFRLRVIWVGNILFRCIGWEMSYICKFLFTIRFLEVLVIFYVCLEV